MAVVHSFDTDPFTSSLFAFGIGRAQARAERNARKRQESIERKQQNAQIASVVGAVVGGAFLGPAIGAIGATAPTVGAIGSSLGGGFGVVAGSAGIGAAAGTLAGSAIGGALGGLVGGRGTGTPGGGAAIGLEVGGKLAALQAAETEGERRTAATALAVAGRLAATQLGVDGRADIAARKRFQETFGGTPESYLADQNAVIEGLLSPEFGQRMSVMSGLTQPGEQGPASQAAGTQSQQESIKRIDQLTRDPNLTQFFSPQDSALRGRLRQAASDVMTSPWGEDTKSRALNEITAKLQQVRPMFRQRPRNAKDAMSFTEAAGLVTYDPGTGKVTQLKPNLFNEEGGRLSDNRRVGEIWIEGGEKLRVDDKGGTVVDISRNDIAERADKNIERRNEEIEVLKELFSVELAAGIKIDVPPRLSWNEAVRQAEKVLLGEAVTPLDSNATERAVPGADDAVGLPVRNGAVLEDLLQDGVRYIGENGASAVWDASIGAKGDWDQSTVIPAPQAAPVDPSELKGLARLKQISPKNREADKAAARQSRTRESAKTAALGRSTELELARIRNESIINPPKGRGGTRFFVGAGTGTDKKVVTIFTPDGNAITVLLSKLTKEEKKKLRNLGWILPGIE